MIAIELIRKSTDLLSYCILANPGLQRSLNVVGPGGLYPIRRNQEPRPLWDSSTSNVFRCVPYRADLSNGSLGL